MSIPRSASCCLLSLRGCNMRDWKEQVRREKRKEQREL